MFNLGEEVSGIPTSLPNGDYEFVEKKNGFMAVVSPDPFDFTGLLVHTQGSLAEGQFKGYVDSMLSNGSRSRIKNWFRVNGPHTLVFEALHPEDKHIVEYEPDDF